MRNLIPFNALSALGRLERTGRGMRALLNDGEGPLAEAKKAIAELKNELKTRDEEIKALVAKAKEDVENHGKILDETKKALAKNAEEATAVQGRLAAIEQAVAAIKPERENKRRSLGAEFTDHASVKALLESKGGKARVKFNSVTSLTSGDGAAGDLIIPQRVPGIITQANRQLRIRDLLPKGRTSSNAVEFVQESGFTNNAAPVAEGAEKPESSLEFTLQNAPVRTLAHWLQASKQILDDVPQLQSYIDTRLRYGLELVEEDQLLAGDGTGQNLLGLIPQATAFDTARKKPGDTRIDIIRRAITQVRLAEYQATAIVLHPTDWEEIELTKDTTDAYIWANPASRLGPTLWGLPVIESTALSEGEFLVGAFDIAAQIWDREDANVEVSTEDRDNFIKNMVTIRAEERLALTVFRPESFVYGDFDDIVSS